MTSERRWLDENAPDEVRALLESAELDEPTTAELESLRARVAPLFDAPPPPSSPAPQAPGPTAPPAPVGAGALAGKILVGITLLAVGGSIGLWFGKREEAPPPAVVAPSPLPREESQGEGARPEAPTVAPPAPVAKKTTPPAPPTRPPPPLTAASEDEELAQLQAAMAAPSAAESLALLEKHAARFPNSNLTQEREVLTVKALMQLERVDEARARAENFKQRWPTSPHLLRVQALVGK